MSKISHFNCRCLKSPKNLKRKIWASIKLVPCFHAQFIRKMRHPLLHLYHNYDLICTLFRCAYWPNVGKCCGSLTWMGRDTRRHIRVCTASINLDPRAVARPANVCAPTCESWDLNRREVTSRAVPLPWQHFKGWQRPHAAPHRIFLLTLAIHLLPLNPKLNTGKHATTLLFLINFQWIGDGSPYEFYWFIGKKLAQSGNIAVSISNTLSSI